MGSISYEIKQLKKPEYIFDDWFPLKGKGEEPIGQIKLTIQWIVSRVDFFTNILNKIDEQITDNNNELGFYKDKLKSLQGICSFTNCRAIRIPESCSKRRAKSSQSS